MRGVYSHAFRTRFGTLRLLATRKGLYALEFGDRGNRRNRQASKTPREVHALLKQASSKIGSMLRGRRVDFANFPIDWTGYRPFAKCVLLRLRRIPWGRTESYQGLARRAGNPKATRSVGQILHANRLPLVVPCHRVIGKRGDLGGFSRGIRTKRYLLKLEGSLVDKKLYEK